LKWRKGYRRFEEERPGGGEVGEDGGLLLTGGKKEENYDVKMMIEGGSTRPVALSAKRGRAIRSGRRYLV
jgi:hypothetical protein